MPVLFNLPFDLVTHFTHSRASFSFLSSVFFPVHLKKKRPLQFFVSLRLHLYCFLLGERIELHPAPVQDPCSVCSSCVHAGFGGVFVRGVRPMVLPQLPRNLFNCRLPTTLELPSMFHPGPTWSIARKSESLERVHSLDSYVQGLPLPPVPLQRTTLSCSGEHHSIAPH